MKETLKILNELKERKLIEDYAIGGGIATIFYVEPFFTYDLDVFIIPMERKPRRNVILLSPIFDYLKDKGYHWKGEHMMIEGIPVQFIPTNKLEEEAVREARPTEYEQVRTKVVTPEYLIPILLMAGRRKDKEKIKKLLEQAKIDKRKLESILIRYGLKDKLKHM
jgi:hypothetical protein